MTVSSHTELTAAALRRFGLGARPGDLKMIGGDPKGAILAELAARSTSLPPDPRLKSVAQLIAAWRVSDLHPYALEELQLRLTSAHAPLVGVNERLVWFWANHLTASAGKNHLMGYVAAPYEREAIRPHVFGKFSDLILASARHYAMLIYLDNQVSVGPNSPYGRAKGLGLNENYAREVLELHTMGVEGGYTQADVTNLAKMLTGWSATTEADAPAMEEGAFLFRPERHEPGAHAFLGQSYAQPGVAQGEAALLAACRRPSTAQFIALKLARHFVSDTPPPALVEKLAKTFRDTDGDLPQIYSALVEAPESWAAFGSKLRTPQEYLYAAERATRIQLPASLAYELSGSMGQRIGVARGPDGFSDIAEAMASPTAARARLDAAAVIAKRVPPGVGGASLATQIFGDLVSLGTLEALEKADRRGFGVALLLASPEFQRR